MGRKAGLNSGEILKVEMIELARQLTVGVREREESMTAVRLLT